MGQQTFDFRDIDADRMVQPPRHLTDEELLALGRDVAENSQPGFEYRGRVMTSVEMMALCYYKKSPEVQFGRRVDDWCERVDHWIREHIDGDRDRVDAATKAESTIGPHTPEDGAREGETVRGSTETHQRK